ncbi:hypothetical protein VKT23_016250 [Stygiomarasmius scandens]|uniref:Uncharacterized protein n=1 Tax=Marasmiellus scandens TaxID=2682957 RepID=A0ABR1IVI1_9AGAR
MIAGWGREFKALKTKHPTQITQQLNDLTNMIGYERIRAESDAVVSRELKGLAFRAAEVGPDREQEWALVPQILLYDIAALGIQAPKRFLWKGYADWAYQHQVCIENWAEGIPAPGSGLTKVNEAVPKAGGPSQLTLARIQELLLMKEGWVRNEENPSIPEHITKAALQVVLWSDEDKALPSDQQKHVALVKCVDGMAEGEEEVEGPRSAKRVPNPKSKSAPKSKMGPTARRNQTPTPTPSPPPVEFEPAPYWQDYCFTESEGDDLRRNPDPTPFSLPVRPDGRAPNLFLGANTQSCYLDTSDDEPEFDKDIAVPSQVHQRSTQPSHSGPIPHLDFRKLPPAQPPHLPPTEDNPPRYPHQTLQPHRQREQAPTASSSRYTLDLAPVAGHNRYPQERASTKHHPSRYRKNIATIEDRNAVLKRSCDNQGNMTSPRKRSKGEVIKRKVQPSIADERRMKMKVREREQEWEQEREREREQEQE